MYFTTKTTLQKEERGQKSEPESPVSAGFSES